MEDYGKFTFRGLGQLKPMDTSTRFQYAGKSKKLHQNSKVKFRLSKKKVKNSSDQETLKLNSKHNSRIRKQHKELEEEQKQGTSDKQNSECNSNINELHDTFVEKCQSEPFDPDTRQEKILTRKQISNLRYLMVQTKELMNLYETLILHEDIKNLKIKLMETQINVRRLRIGSRHQSKDHKVMVEYYKRENEVGRPRVNHTRNLTNLVGSCVSSCEYYGIEQKKEQNKKRGELLRARAKTIMQYIEVQRSKSKKKQQLLKNEIVLMKKQSAHFQQATRRTSRFLSGMENKMWNLEAFMSSSNLKESMRGEQGHDCQRLQLKEQKSIVLGRKKIRYSQPISNEYLVF